MREPMLALLLAGGGVYMLLGSREEALILLAFACLSVGITVVQEARTRLSPKGRLLLAISEEETAGLAALPGVQLGRVWPIPAMIRQQIAEFRFEDET